jgi:cyclophilin family peptidyl-prolyl cis-trans isomerase
MQASASHLARRVFLSAFSMAVLAMPAWAETAAAAPKVVFQTTLGEFVVEVYPDKAPKTVENFLRYVKDKQYDGTIFHRVIPNFMVQGGGYNVKLEEKIVRPPVPLEAQNGLKHEMGTIAMARTNEPNSARAQFFVNVKENPFLNAKGPSDGYTVFGRVVSGMETIEKIKNVPTGSGGPFPTDVPKTPVVINSATLVK